MGLQDLSDTGPYDHQGAINTAVDDVKKYDDDRYGLQYKDDDLEDVIEKPQKPKWQHYLNVFLCSAGLIIFGTLQVVAFKRLAPTPTTGLGPYPYFILLTVSFMFVPIYFTGVVVILLTTHGFAPETTTWKFKRHYCVIGFFNALNGVMLLFAIPHSPGIVQATFTQAIIPFVMIISYFALKTRYTLYQYLGATIIVIGVLIDILPEFVGGGGDDSDPSPSPSPAPMSDLAGGDSSDTGGASVVWWFLFLFGMAPAAAQGVYQEKSFRGGKVNVVYMMSWASLSQFSLLLCLIPLNFIPKFGGIPPGDFGTYMKDAALCFVNADVESGGMYPDADCEGSAVWLMLAMLSMLLAQFFQALVIKISTATLSVLLMTAIVPLSAICFTFGFIMGPYTEAFTPISLASLFLVVVGLLIYRFMRRDRPPITWILGVPEIDEEEVPLNMDEKEQEEEAERERTISTRVGMIDVEIFDQEGTDEKGNKVSLLYEHTIPYTPQHDEESNEGNDEGDD